MPAVYGIDLIAKRDKKRKMDRSIIKGWNVHYQTLEEAEEAARLKKQKQDAEAMDSSRLDEEDGKDGETVKDEEEAVGHTEKAFNRKTHSYSGEYGRHQIHDEEKQQQIHAILNEKPDAYSSAMSALQAREGSVS